MKKQDGFVSIIMALVIMIFITLIALGFAFLARQNQYQNQNRVLSTQAFYAAESGVNDVVDYLKNNPSHPASVNTCNGPLAGYVDTVGSTNNQIKYTCVLYDTAPTTLEYNVDTKDSRTVRVQSENGRPFTSITISWQDSQGSSNFATNNQHFLPQNAFSTANPTNGDSLSMNTGIVRATLIPIFNPMTRADLTNKAMTAFLYPKAGPVSTEGTQAYLTSNSISDANQGVFVDGNCNTGNPAPPKNLKNFCNVTITGLDGALSSSNTFYIRLKSLYRSSKISVSGITNDGQTARLVNEQAVVDSTGKASDVLRRIQVRVPLSTAFNRPEFAIETVDSLCKRLQVWPGGADVDVPAVAGGTPAACQL